MANSIEKLYLSNHIYLSILGEFNSIAKRPNDTVR